MTTTQLITRALRTIGVVAAGESLNAAWLEAGQDALGDLMDSWAANRLTIYVVERNVYTLISGRGGPAPLSSPYTIGPGGDFNQARPVYFDRASVINLNNPTQPLELGLDVLDTQDWQAIPVKQVLAALPLKIYFDYDFPLGNVFLWPIPNVTNLQLVIYSPTAITGFTDLTTNFTYPPGYAEALRYNLAIRLAPEFGRQLDPQVAAMAVSTLAVVKRANIRMQDLVIDPALLNKRAFYDWRSDQTSAGPSQ